MSLGLATTPCTCNACGWTGNRSPRHMAKPCPNCHQRSVVLRDGDDRKGAKVMGLAMLAAMAAAAVAVVAIR